MVVFGYGSDEAFQYALYSAPLRIATIVQKAI
jgi:hypothetical protein